MFALFIFSQEMMLYQWRGKGSKKKRQPAGWRFIVERRDQ
jgi:hypothetical protein